MISKWISSRRRPLRPGEREALSLLGVVLGLVLLTATLVGLEYYRGGKLQHRRNAEQAQLVDAIESLHIPVISEVVTDWLLTYPEPNDERLAELRDLARQVQSDPTPLLGATARPMTSEALVPANSRAAADSTAQPLFARSRAGQ